ncbi:hypothetical protein [Hymenobacter crusticola]|uniref:Glutathionylspermidine synthase pre-ATP-grasp-like domain-containing protein n=1 Tax=Hymenobacter crusticola TaxID=1770526 RepID=A0A243W9C0_9BACT|nr:hypothetical protein [Hymenobacter crusticola]OUJ71804.1 hypothetical protein BXP70_20860 [Hymenobacter crusticola]
MIPNHRATFNEAFSPERYQEMLASMAEDLPGLLDFRIAETPIFVPAALRDKLISAGESIIDVLTAANFKELTEGAVPPHQRVPHEDAHTAFLAIDYAICRNTDGELEPQLIELQGFPSLYAFQDYLPGKFRQFYPISDAVSQLFNVSNSTDYFEQLRQLIVADENPENVILLELFPEKQKTRLDFELTHRGIGVEAVCLTKVRKNGRQLYYEKEGRQIPIKRIYNRLIFDELEQHPDLKTEFRLTDDVDVKWVGHPNWFFRISKYTMPLLHHAFVPPSHYLSDLASYPADLENYVLKPLFSFAGSGVQLDVTAADLDAITDRHNYLLQRKVQYEPVIQSPDGLVKCEIRMLYIWHEQAARPMLITNLGRLSRGAMIGVNFNKNKDWVGGTVCLFE